MASRNENSGPVTRKRRKVDTQKVKDQERVQKRLQPVVVIGPNDIVFNGHLGKVKIEQEEWEVKPEASVQVQVNEETLEEDENNIDLEEDDAPVMEEDELQGNSEDSVMLVEELRMLNDNTQIVEEDSEEFSVANEYEKLLEENRELKISLERRETKDFELDKLLQERKAEHETLQKQVQTLKGTDSIQQERIKTLHNMIADLEVEGEEIQNAEGQTLNRVPNLPGTSSVPEVDKILALFAEVIQLIHKKEQSRQKFRRKLLRRVDFSNCRLVCSAWKDAIDEIEDGPCRALQKEITVFYDGDISWRYGRFKVKDDEKTDVKKERRINKVRLFETYSPHSHIHWYLFKHGPTKMGRRTQKQGTIPQFSLSIVYSDFRGVVKEEDDKVTKLLAEVGQTVKELSFYQDYDSKDSYKMPERFIRILKFLPNLTKVHEEYYYHPRRVPIGGNYKSCCSTNKTKKLPKFPSLPKLRHLHESDWPYGLFKEALAANPEITGLNLSDFTKFKDLIPINLKELTLSCYFVTLEKLSKLKLPFLEKLTLRKGLNDNDEGEKGLYSGKFTELKGTLFDSIKILDICFYKNDQIVFPKMPQLKTLVLKFESINNHNCNQEEHIIDFVGQFTSVENVILKGFVGCNCITNRCGNWDKQPFEKSMRFKKMKTKLVKYLWTTVPNLKKVEIRHETETRKVKPFEFVFLREFNSC